jgi:hypothetical protein
MVEVVAEKKRWGTSLWLVHVTLLTPSGCEQGPLPVAKADWLRVCRHTSGMNTILGTGFGRNRTHQNPTFIEQEYPFDNHSIAASALRAHHTRRRRAKNALFQGQGPGQERIKLGSGTIRSIGCLA